MGWVSFFLLNKKLYQNVVNVDEKMPKSEWSQDQVKDVVLTLKKIREKATSQNLTPLSFSRIFFLKV